MRAWIPARLQRLHFGQASAGMTTGEEWVWIPDQVRNDTGRGILVWAQIFRQAQDDRLCDKLQIS